jgi:Reverse transcriptase (RNA-dependent DNA polymerase)
VVNDVLFRVLIVMIIVLKLQAISLDVETAFLHGYLEEEIYMKCPYGVQETEAHLFSKVDDSDCLRLSKSIYGLMQAARQWWKTFTSEVKHFGFMMNEIDPCLLYRQDECGVCIIALYVDDSILAGHQKAIDKAVKEIKSVFTIKVQGSLDDCRGCDINSTKTGAQLGLDSRQ